MRCADCRFWNHTDESASIVFDPGKEGRKRCLRILHDGGRPEAERNSPTATEEPAVLTDCCDWAASLWTAPDFGCSLFAERLPISERVKP